MTRVREEPRRGAEEPYFSTKSLSKLKNSFFAGSLGTLMYQNFDRRTCTCRMRHLLFSASRFRGFLTPCDPEWGVRSGDLENTEHACRSRSLLPAPKVYFSLNPPKSTFPSTLPMARPHHATLKSRRHGRCTRARCRHAVVYSRPVHPGKSPSGMPGKHVGGAPCWIQGVINEGRRLRESPHRGRQNRCTASHKPSSGCRLAPA